MSLCSATAGTGATGQSWTGANADNLIVKNTVSFPDVLVVLIVCG